MKTVSTPFLGSVHFRIYIVSVFWTLLAVTSAHAQPGEEQSIRIAVASNFEHTLNQLAGPFEEESGVQLVAVSGSTGKLFAQLMNGAPYDIFLAADTLRPALLEARGVAVRGSRTTYALGRLVIWTGYDGVDLDGENIPAAVGSGRIAIANPDLAPYGHSARSWLTRKGIWDALQDRLVRGENIGQAFHFVYSGNAIAGFVSLAQVRQVQDRRRGAIWEIPVEELEPIVQQGVIIRESEAARTFMNFLHGERAAQILLDAGYLLPE